MFVLITGGSGSGKSAFAEEKIVSFGDFHRIYIATMYPFDQESFQRIERHRKMREGKKFATKECYTGLKKLLFDKKDVVLLECMSNLTANEMFQEQGAGIHTVEEVVEGIKSVLKQVSHLVVVTNEIFSESCFYEGETEQYQHYLGEINQAMAEMADEVVEVVYGIPVYHKQGVRQNEKYVE